MGIAGAQLNLGYLLSEGLGTAPDLLGAFKWYRAAAASGIADAQNTLGYLLSVGERIPHDYVQAADWYRKAAIQGHTAAQMNLGVAYATGRGVRPDYVEAYMWLSLAVAAGNHTAVQGLRYLHDLMTTKQMQEAQARAATWRQTEVQAGNLPSINERSASPHDLSGLP
jgi:TPR repeat protein